MDLYFFIQATNTMFCGFLPKHILSVSPTPSQLEAVLFYILLGD